MKEEKIKTGEQKETKKKGELTACQARGDERDRQHTCKPTTLLHLFLSFFFLSMSPSPFIHSSLSLWKGIYHTKERRKNAHIHTGVSERERQRHPLQTPPLLYTTTCKSMQQHIHIHIYTHVYIHIYHVYIYTYIWVEREKTSKENQ